MPKPPPPPLILPTVPSGGGYTPIPYGGDNGSINFPSNGGTGGSTGGGGGAGGSVSQGGGSVKQGGNSNLPDIPKSLDKAATGIGLATDFHGVPVTAAKLAASEGTEALKMLSRSGTVVGAIVSGVPAGYNIIKDIRNGGISNTHLKGWGALVLAGGGVAVEFFGVGETWDIVGAGITGTTAVFDITNAFSK